MINIPPSVDIVTVYQTVPHTGSLDGSLHCTTKLQAVIVSGEMFISVILSGGPEMDYQIIHLSILNLMTVFATLIYNACNLDTY